MRQNILLCVLILLCFQNYALCGWFFTSKDPPPGSNPEGNSVVYANDAIAEFSVESLSTNPSAVKKVENAKRKVVSSNTCWQNAYKNLFAGCSEILADEEKRSRLAWHLSDCFQKDSGRPSFPRCDAKGLMVNCLKKLDEDARKVYLEFYLETNAICHQLQTDAFKRNTEKLVNDLKSSAEYAVTKLEKIGDQADTLIRSSNQIDGTLKIINSQTHQISETSKIVEGSVNTVLKCSKDLHEQSKGMVSSQSKLLDGQEKMKVNLDEGMEKIQHSYTKLGEGVGIIQNETVKIEKVVKKVGVTMEKKMNSIQSKADDIGKKAGISLDRQKQLLEGQTVALEGLQFLTKFQSQALEESRGNLQQLAEYGHKQQEELLKRQEQLKRSHDNLVMSSKTILDAQEAFESKQASMFLAIDKLFALHNAILLESRLIKAFFVYFIAIFILYMFTSTKQTYTVRPRLYIGLCATFAIEASILRYIDNDIERQGSLISIIRALFAILASAQLIYTIYTYRDYEKLNHNMLVTLIDQVNGIKRNKEEGLLGYESDSESDWGSFIVAELPEDVSKLEDPDYLIPEGVGENGMAKCDSATSFRRSYNLRRNTRNS